MVIGHTRAVVDDESSKPHERETHSPAAPEPEHSFGELRHYVPQDILDVSFPVTVRGYNRRAVDAYIKHVNRVIAELKVSASPPAAVRHALEQAEEKVQGLLHAAREAADELTTSARREAEASTARAKAEAAELIANARREADETVAKAKADADEMVAEARAEAQNTLARAQAEADEHLQRSREELAALRNEAETRMHEIQADAAAVWKQRRELLDDIRGMASSLVDAANAAAGRFPRQEPTGPEEQMLRPEADAETEPAGIPTDQSAPALPAAGSDEGGTSLAKR